MPGEALLNWYEAVRRPLPWRFTRDPWALLVSEVMLQQTQAARVVPHYERFLARFPTRRRSRRRRRRRRSRRGAGSATTAARWRCRRRRGSSRPTAGRRGLEELPGVGPYTAAAVASFAWDAQVAAVDTNVRRVIERRDGVRRTPRALARRAAELLPEGRAAAWNQAMMELGATVCRPRRPLRRVPAAARAARGLTRSRRPARPRGERFEASDRWARGRLLAALVAGRSRRRSRPSGASARSPASSATA